jgi:hypothetical protein
MAVLIALLMLVVAFAVGVWLFVDDHLIIGFAVIFASIPIAIGTWMAVNDRRGI